MHVQSTVVATDVQQEVPFTSTVWPNNILHKPHDFWIVLFSLSQIDHLSVKSNGRRSSKRLLATWTMVSVVLQQHRVNAVPLISIALHCVISVPHCSLFQMYIALVSLHALVMVVFHFLNCFEEDWTCKWVFFNYLKCFWSDGLITVKADTNFNFQGWCHTC